MKRYIPLGVNSIVIFLLLTLPYYIFQGKLFVGGDDTRLQYIFPWEHLQHLSFFSWNNISSISYYVPNYFSIPQVLLWAYLDNIIKSKIIIDYLAFSFPVIIGYIFMQLLLGELLERVGIKEKIITALFFILSPIMIQTQISVSLNSVWLIGFIPIIFYYLLKYIKTENIVYIFIASIWSLVFSLATYAFPWIFGLFLPILLSIPLVVFFYPKYKLFQVGKNSLIFFVIICLAQLFWILPFLSTFIGGGNNLGAKALTAQVGNTFKPTVLSTAIGNVFYPLLNFFHRQIIEVFDWQTKGIFESFYDKIAFLNTFYIGVIIFSLIILKTTKQATKRIYIFLFCAFLISLYFFTVNVGPFREIFLFGGYIPGFVMFRNFYDKFAFGFVFLYSIVIGISLFIIGTKFPKVKNILFFILLALIIINSIPIKNVVNSPLWTTQHTYRTITFPREYLNFIDNVKRDVSPSTNVLSLPLNIAAYSVIKEDGSNNVYAGTSPLKILTGINDYSGNLSFSPDESNNIGKLMKERKFDLLSKLFQKYNVSYILLTKNIPLEVKTSYLFGSGTILENQDSEFINSLIGDKVITSTKGNYELYKSKYPSSIFSLTKGRLIFEKISPVHYILKFVHVDTGATLLMRDSFHNGWNIFLTNNNWNCENGRITTYGNIQECIKKENLFSLNDLTFLWKGPVMTSGHTPFANFGQQWNINVSPLQKDIVKNEDGSISFIVDLYFKPQLLFYLGLFVSVITILILFIMSVNKLMQK